MAYKAPKDLDGFIPLLSKPDTRYRLQVGSDLLAFLGEPTNPTVCQDIGVLIDATISWMQSSNYKVSSNGIDVMTYLIDRLGSDFRPYLQTVLPSVVDRLGDAKDTVREKSQLLILKLLEKNVLSPQTLLEKLAPCFTHKNAKIREEVLRCLINTLNEHGAQSVTLNRLIPDIVKLLSDPTSTVRDTALNTLVDLYKHVGEKLRMDLQRRNIVPPMKWQALSARFDEANEAGELLVTATKSPNMDCERDVVDRALMPKPAIPAKKANLRLMTPTHQNAAVLSKLGSIKKLPHPSSATGGVDEDTFGKAFEDVPNVRIFSPREVTEQFKIIYDTISDTNKDWSKRAEALKKIRSLILADATNYDEFYIGLKQLEYALQGTIKDLRSQVVREACITISYLAQVLGVKFDRTAELLLAQLINLIQNSAKIVSTSGLVTIRFIIQNIPSARLLPIITSHAISSKSKDIRRSCCEFLDYILNHWPLQALEKHLAALQDSVKKGIADADPEARVFSRRAFQGFRQHFPDQSEALLQSLEPSYRKALQVDSMSASSSNNNIAGGLKSARSGYGRYLGTDSTGKGFRSNSAIDLQAAQRANARSQYGAMARKKIAMGTASLPRPKKSPDAIPFTAVQSAERTSRRRIRNSQSQPTSRSSSPSSRLAYYRGGGDYESPRAHQQRIGYSGGIPRSTKNSRETSRETSPNRSLTFSPYRHRNNDRPPLSPASRPVLAQKILQQSKEAENAFADAFNESGDSYRTPPRKILRSIDNHSDESETSSVCSERSFDSYRRTSDDINEIVVLCASTTWQERKDGLLSLHHYLSNEEGPISQWQLQHLKESFTKMFMDSHTKGFSVFLDTIQEFIRIYKEDLHDWIYVLLQRIFLKMGNELLSSLQSKLLGTLEIIRDSFPNSLLISNVYRFLVDATQTPQMKVKIIVVRFLTSLCNSPDGSEAIGAPPAGQALQKLIYFTQDMKSMELRTAAKSCIVSMWNCNTPAVTIILSDLPKEQQDIARSIVQNHMRKNSTGSESPLVSLSPKILSPISPTDHKLDQEEVYKCLRKTTSEIQNYSYEKIDKDRDTTSQDSGISQMSVGNDLKNEVAQLEDRMEELNLKSNFHVGTGPRSLPPYTSVNGITETDSSGYRSLGGLNQEDLVRTILEKCVAGSNSMTDQKGIEEQKILLGQFIQMIRLGQLDSIKKNFRKILRLIVDHIDQNQSETKIKALEILAVIFQCQELQELWSWFVELLTLKVYSAHCDDKREVVKAAEDTATAMRTYFPLNNVVTSLTPVLKTTPEDIQLLAVLRMLTKVLENNIQNLDDQYIPEIMPELIKAASHNESTIRKSAIFCLVALYRLVGEERLKNYLSLLPGSKLKLVMLYVHRSESSQSVLGSSKPTS